MQSSTRILTGLLTLALCGITYASLSLAESTQDHGESLKTKQHELVQAGIGAWEGHVTMHMPELPEPESAPCTEVVTGIGDLWTTSRFEMNFMGTRFAGSSTFGYDTVKEKFVGTWVDSMNPTITLMEGDYDEDKGAIVMYYDMYEPMTKAVKKVRSELVHSGDSYVLSFFDLTEEGESMTMQIEMERK